MKKLIALVLALSLLGLVGCGKSDSGEKPAAKLNMEELYTSLLETKDMTEMVRMNEGMMLNVCGIQAEDCVQAVVAVAGDGLLADEIWLIEAKDADTLSSIKTLSDNRLKQKGDESVTYSPEQYEVVKAAHVITESNYLIMLVSPNADTMEAAVRTALGK